MRSKYVGRAFVVGAVVLTAGVLFSANMGVKIHYDLVAKGDALPEGGTSAGGQSQICLPYIRMDSLIDSESLFHHINSVAGADAVKSVSRFLRESDALESYTGTGAQGLFPLSAAEGYRVQVDLGESVGYKIVGSHDPGALVTLYPAGTGEPPSATGQTEYCPPFHATSQKASDLRNEINGFAGGNVVWSISRFVRSADAFETYVGKLRPGGIDFDVIPGESYRIQIDGTEPVAFAPSHY